ncbi:hypothetical protein [Gluconacetobacter sp.]|uniref:hypothetical protein n=1 Tax=Gluconacetobacter sp. TaxID=1935994 RepID=UPI0039EBCCAA
MAEARSFDDAVTIVTMFREAAEAERESATAVGRIGEACLATVREDLARRILIALLGAEPAPDLVDA